MPVRLRAKAGKGLFPFLQKNARLFHHSRVGRVRESIRRQRTSSDVGPLLDARFGIRIYPPPHLIMEHGGLQVLDTVLGRLPPMSKHRGPVGALGILGGFDAQDPGQGPKHGATDHEEPDRKADAHEGVGLLVQHPLPCLADFLEWHILQRWQSGRSRLDVRKESHAHSGHRGYRNLALLARGSHEARSDYSRKGQHCWE